MTGEDYGQLLYLALLAAAVAGYFFAQNRQRLSTTMQQAAIWGLIFLGVVAGYGLWGDIRGAVAPQQMRLGEDGRVELRRQTDGHFHVTLAVEGVPVEFIVDTGATDLVLTREDAARIGLDLAALRFTGIAETANGTVPIAPVRLSEVRLGDAVDRNVRATVNGGDLFQSLLGMSYLSRFARIEIAGDRLVLTR